MKKLIKSATKYTPEIILKPEGTIKITGRSMNGYTSEYFRQIEDWIDNYISDPADITCVDICLEYFKGINFTIYISLLKKIESVRLKNKKVIINWYYEEDDEDILENGEYISTLLGIPFNFIRINDARSWQCGQSMSEMIEHLSSDIVET